jgi:hypothetical protein
VDPARFHSKCSVGNEPPPRGSNYAHVLSVHNHKIFLPKPLNFSPFSLLLVAPCTAHSSSRSHSVICLFSVSFFIHSPINWFALITLPKAPNKLWLDQDTTEGLSTLLSHVPLPTYFPPSGKIQSRHPFSTQLYPVNISPVVSAGGSRTQLLIRLISQGVAAVQILWYMSPHQRYPWRWRHCDVPKRPDQFTHRSGAISGKSGIFVNKTIYLTENTHHFRYK